MTRNRTTVSSNIYDTDAYKFDQVLKKLETTKQQKQQRQRQLVRRRGRHSLTSTVTSESRHHSDSSDNSSRGTESSNSNGSAFGYDSGVGGGGGADERNDDECSSGNSTSESRIFETRQSFVDRRAGGSISRDLVHSFTERGQSREQSDVSDGGELDSHCERDTMLVEEGLPDAILKLDRRHDIPATRHENDVLVQIEASTVDRRALMVRPGIRCNTSLPQGVETIGLDCIGRVVKISTRARAVYGISTDDRIAAIYPFEYKAERKERGRRKNKYALVDAGFAVTVPKNVDSAEAACMIRLYLSAFQSLMKGVSGIHTDRYGVNQLKGQSILIQNGETELGRVLIELASLLGASQIFATGPTESHPLLEGLGAIPLGAKTFSWELFLEEKISLVLVQEIPTEDNFEQLISVLDENKGVLVYMYHDGHKLLDEDDLGSVANNIGCDGLHFHELTKKALNAMNSAKFSLRLACSPKYMVYEGVWPSCKEDPNQFKEDLRYLFTLLERGNLNPTIAKCIDLEEVPEVQDTIELLGKQGTIVCLPTALYEKKACHVVPPEISLKKDDRDFLVRSVTQTSFGAKNTAVLNYAVDAGYSTGAQNVDTLSDFHRMRDEALSLEEETTSCLTTPNFASAKDQIEYNFDGYSIDEHNSAAASVSRVPEYVTSYNASPVLSMSQTAVPNEMAFTSRHRSTSRRRYKSYREYQQQRREGILPSQNATAERAEQREVMVGSPSRERHNARKLRREARRSKLSADEKAVHTRLDQELAEMENGRIAITSDVVHKVDANDSSKPCASPSWKVKFEEDKVHADSRSEDDSGEEEATLSFNDNSSSFSRIMNKWKNSDDLSRQSENSLSKLERRRMM